MVIAANPADAELLADLRSVETTDKAIKGIYRTYFESLGWYVMNNSGSREDAEDVFQEVVINFIELVQKNKFRGESSVKTFLFSLNRHIWLNELKKRGRALKREEKYQSGQEAEEKDVAGLITDREERKQIMLLVDQLGETCKKILLSFYFDNLSMKEILDTMHYENEQVVRNKKYKCLKQLEQLIAAHPSVQQNLKTLLNG